MANSSVVHVPTSVVTEVESEWVSSCDLSEDLLALSITKGGTIGFVFSAACLLTPAEDGLVAFTAALAFLVFSSSSEPVERIILSSFAEAEDEFVTDLDMSEEVVEGLFAAPESTLALTFNADETLPPTRDDVDFLITAFSCRRKSEISFLAVETRGEGFLLSVFGGEDFSTFFFDALAAFTVETLLSEPFSS